MISFIIQNIATVIISLVLILIVAAIVAGLIKNKKKGKSSCGYGCANCAMQNMCHKS